ncbi:MAG TPA: hypothetical protein P5545_05290 [Bacteroidota bacterium]|nr:hypothetical protein [Candidatus Kapabacteria bacterium]HRS01946.1 hypothetical protein [Bacteroidota bacterium]
MKQITKIATILLLVCVCVGCSQKAKEEKLLNIYKQILIVRVSETDSSVANQKVRQILQNNGYTIETFKKEFIEVAKNNKNFFAQLDSLRNSLNREYNQKIDSVKKNQSSPIQ